MVLTFLSAVLAIFSGIGPDTLVVCPEEFREALAPWVEYRRDQGHQLLVIAPPHKEGRASAHALSQQIRRIARSGKLRYVVLVGDVAGDCAASVVVPTHYVRAKVNVRWGSEPFIATDQGYADTDGDLLPDLAVGRIPADSPAELAAVIRKILRYEQQAKPGDWQRRVNIVAGSGGFGPVTDMLIEMAARSVIRQTLPANYTVSQTIAGGRSRAGSTPPQFVHKARQRLNEKSLAWIYLGHGLPTRLVHVLTPQGDPSILSVDDVSQIRCSAASPLAVLVACYTGAFDGSTDCLAEELVLHEQGPVAVIAATRVTMPYGNAVLGCELLRACCHDREAIAKGEPGIKSKATLGDRFVTAGRQTLRKSTNDPLRQSLDSMAQGLSPPPVDLEAERREHVWMYHLLGDPLLRLPSSSEASNYGSHHDAIDVF